MSDAGDGDIKESIMEDEIKIEPASIDCHANRYGESSHSLQMEEDGNLIKQEDGSFDNFHCSKCKGTYKGFCLKCSTLLRILNSNSIFVSSESELNTMPTDILEVRETSKGKGVYLLRTLPMNIIFGPFEGILGIESTVGHHWKIIDNKLKNIKSGNWMKNIICAGSCTFKNLNVLQLNGNLYYQTNREINEGEELLIYYDDEELHQLSNCEEFLYTPRKQELPKIFACTICCLGFGSSECLMEHKKKTCQMKHSNNIQDFVLILCRYCKVWMEKSEHEKVHVAYCLKKHPRMESDYSEAVDRSDICSRPYDRRDNLQFDRNDYQCFSGGNHETRSNQCALTEYSNNEQMQNTIETNFQNRLTRIIRMMKSKLTPHKNDKEASHETAKDDKRLEYSDQTNEKGCLERHQNTYIRIKLFKCDMCIKSYTSKRRRKAHIKSKHIGHAKEYNCLECSFQTDIKQHFEMHKNIHKDYRPFKCNTCMAIFTARTSLDRHIKDHHTDGEKNYKCLECPYRTNVRCRFVDHQTRHGSLKPFPCNVCRKSYTSKNYLRAHTKAQHTDGDKHYKCSECCYQTRMKVFLESHQNMHKGIKPYVCEICMKHFSTNRYLKLHTKNRHTDGPKYYKCSKCCYATNAKGCLKRHQKTHIRNKPFKCNICMKEFSTKSYTNLHMKNKHSDDAKN